MVNLNRSLHLAEQFHSIICAGFGFAITKADIFPTVASRAAGQIILVSNTFKSVGARTKTLAENHVAMSYVFEDCACFLDIKHWDIRFVYLRTFRPK